MADDKPNASGKKIIAGLAAGILLICLLAAAAILIWSYAGTSMLTYEVQLQFAGNNTVSDEQLAQTKNVLQKRFQELGNSVSVTAERDEHGNASVLIRHGGLPYDYVVSTATAPGVFEMRVQTQGSQSEHILYGDEIKSVSGPVEMPDIRGTTSWGVSLELTPAGAQKFQKACIEAGATADPESHQIAMSLDGSTVHRAPLSAGLASQVNTTPPDYLMLSTGTGDAGKAEAQKIIATMQSGALPVPLEAVNVTHGTNKG